MQMRNKTIQLALEEGNITYILFIIIVFHHHLRWQKCIFSFFLIALVGGDIANTYEMKFMMK